VLLSAVLRAGTVQLTLVELGKTWDGNVDYFRNNSVDHTNATHAWNVILDRSIYNARF
jgi:hypothetical protein